MSIGLLPAPSLGRRSFLGLTAGLLALPIAASRGEERRYRIGFANLTEDAGTRIEGLGFTGAEIRASFLLAARSLPVEMVFYDNDRNREKTLANADDAIAHKLDLFIEYSDDTGANADVGKRMKAAGIPVLAVTYPVPGAPLYGPDNALAGRLAGEALARFANATWPGRPAAVALVGDLGNGGDHVAERVEAIAADEMDRIEDRRIRQLQVLVGREQRDAAGELRRYRPVVRAGERKHERVRTERAERAVVAIAREERTAVIEQRLRDNGARWTSDFGLRTSGRRRRDCLKSDV